MDATVILVHGAFHGGWCWHAVVEGLAAEGIGVLALDLPGHGENPAALGGLQPDATAVRELLEHSTGPLVLCGHSYGGAVITQAASRAAGVAHLVYLAAVVPDCGESLTDCVPEILSAPIFQAARAREDGNLVIDPKRAAEIFYSGCDASRAEWAVSKLGAQHPQSLTEAATQTAWREIPSTYVVCAEDAAIDVAAQERMAKRATAAVRWSSDHSPMLSDPSRVVGLLTAVVEALD